MSIIHEALKKTDPSGEPAKPGAGQGPLHRRAHSGGWGLLFMIMICFLIAGPLLFPLLVKAPAGSSPQETSTASGQFAIEEAPRPAAMTAPSPWRGFARPAGFVLSGVLYSGEDSYCVINGLVLRRGERVGGATVETIGPDQVTLDSNGEKIILPVALSR